MEYPTIVKENGEPKVISPTKTCAKCGRELPLTSFKRLRNGETGDTCKECFAKALAVARDKKLKVEEAKKETEEKTYRQKRLEALYTYTPRELMAELKRRGYGGELEFVEVHKIKLKDI